MPSAAIGNGVKINHVFVEGGVLESMTALTMTVMTAGGFIFSEVVVVCRAIYIFNIYIIYIDRIFSVRWRVDK